MNTAPDINKYCDQMELVKKRIDVVLCLRSGSSRMPYEAAVIEAIYLQFRKVLELIAMASLIANKEVYEREHANFAKHWNARRMFESLERLNPSFYPQPIDERDMRILDKTTGYLTKDDFLQLYESCGGIMHTNNPYGLVTDYSLYESQIERWTNLIMGLLNSHKIHLINDPNMYVIHMQEAQDNKVHGYTFAPMPKNA